MTIRRLPALHPAPAGKPDLGDVSGLQDDGGAPGEASNRTLTGWRCPARSCCQRETSARVL
ncbi:hypothetical protein ACFXJ8_16030 [Nonomuraea sp. NPDC059194]|uniref:hypothetical protein n=1 Tax=Nonomuraea sp. NPDC059194 TaxID=3346764 RepID=UPI0036C5659D